jgi:hypothetical protein
MDRPLNFPVNRNVRPPNQDQDQEIIMTITFSAAGALMRRSRSGRWRLGSNTYLYPRGDSYAVRYHYTDVVTIHPDGTFTLSTGGWETITTKQRINGYGPARVYSGDHGQWAVWTEEDPRTPPKLRPCRKCKGAGRVVQPGYRSYYESGWTDSGEYWSRPIFPPKITLSRWAECYNCDGTGQRDYGSKPMPVVFSDGIRVDGYGRVLDAASRERLNDPDIIEQRKAAQKAARLAEAEAERRAWMNQAIGRYLWIRDHELAAAHGEVVMFKAVHRDLRSHHGADYQIGTTVTAPDYEPGAHCGGGLHFSPTVYNAMSYDDSATRFLACAVDRRTMVVIGDKVKARSCRVLYEVDQRGEPLNPIPAGGGPVPDPAVFG